MFIDRNFLVEASPQFRQTIEVSTNHAPVETDAATTLAELLMQEGIAADGIAVAIANKVVPRSEWPTTRLQAGTKIPPLRAVCGG